MENTDGSRQLKPFVTEPGTAEYAKDSSVTEPTPECSRCRFYTADIEGRIFGRCRRYAPKPLTAGGEADRSIGDVIWPRVYEVDWCGEFQARPEDTIQCESRDG